MTNPSEFAPSSRSLPTELWIDDAPKTVLTPKYFDALASIGISGIAVMIDTTKKGWDPTWSIAQMEKLAALAEPRQIGVILTTWPDPVKDYLVKMEKGIVPLLEAARAVAWEVDVEFNWKPGRVIGFKPTGGRSALDLAGDRLVEVMAEVKEKLDVRTELTTFSAHTENGRTADIAPDMDLLMVQAYSVRKRPEGQAIPWDHTYGPGRMQKFTLDRTLLVKGTPTNPRIGCGLAAWDQTWPGHDPNEAMTVAYDAACGYPIERVRFWSSKWVIGARKNGYSAKFIASINGR